MAFRNCMHGYDCIHKVHTNSVTNTQKSVYGISSLMKKKFFFWKVKIDLNSLSANPTKWSNTLKQFVGKLLTNCLSVFDHFVKLVLKGLKMILSCIISCDGCELWQLSTVFVQLCYKPVTTEILISYPHRPLCFKDTINAYFC